MTLRVPLTGPAPIVKGVDTDVVLTFYDATEAALSLTSATVKAYEGSTLMGTYTPTPSGGTVTATVLGTDSTSGTLGGSPWSLLWTISDGVTTWNVKTRAVLIIREAVVPILSSDVTEDHPELADLVASAAIKTAVQDAWDEFARDLDSRGNSVHLLSDPADAVPALTALAASLCWARYGTDERDEQALQRARDLRAIYVEKAAGPFRYDADADDVEDTKTLSPEPMDWWDDGRRS